MLPLLEAYSLGAGANYEYHGIEKAFELAVMEYPFSFWQYGWDCDKIPDSSVSDLDAMKYFTSVSDLTFFSDEDITTYGSHYYQSATEFGYYGYETAEFKGLLKALSPDVNPHATFLSKDMTNTAFRSEPLQGINTWLPKHGHKIIHIYGTLDTWSATSVPPSNDVDAIWFFMNGKHHANANISNMTPDEKERLKSTLERWLSIDIKN